MNVRVRAIDTALVQGLIGLCVAAIGCEATRVEYHHRPGYFRSMGGANQPERVTLDDGTVLVFTSRQPTSGLDHEIDENTERFRIREETDDGTVILRALLPQQVLANTLTCLRNHEYELIWEQLLADRTKRAYAARGQGYEEFESFFAANRIELAATLTRMMMGLTRQESYMENVGDGVVRFRFHPRVGSEFRFKTINVISEGGGLRLLMVR